MTKHAVHVRSALLILRRRAASLAHAAIKEGLGVMALVPEVRPPRCPSTNQSLPSSAPFAVLDKPSTRESGAGERVALSDEVLGPAPTSDTEKGLGGPSLHWLNDAAATVGMTQTVFR